MEQVVGTSGGLLKYVHIEYFVGTVLESPYFFISFGLQRRGQYQSVSGLRNCTRLPQHWPEPVNAFYEMTIAIDAEVHFLLPAWTPSSLAHTAYGAAGSA